MVSYLIRRLMLASLTLLFITAIVYGLIRFMPGTPLTVMQGEDPSRKMSAENLKLALAEYGLDKPWYIGYFDWLIKLPTGDMGTSFRERRPVLSVIGQRIGPTLLLSVTSLIVIYVLSVPIGLFCTAYSGRPSERALSVLLYMLYSLPTYVAALQLLLIFYVKFKGTAFQLQPGMVSDNYADLSAAGKFTDILSHLFLPLVCFTYTSLAYDSRFIKANMEEAIRQDYIRTARAKGAGPVRVLIWHAFRNTLIPFVTLLGLTLPGLLSGAIILEQIFNWPGMGRLYFESITVRDYPVIMGLTLMFSVLTLAGQLLADVLYAAVDPRITFR